MDTEYLLSFSIVFMENSSEETEVYDNGFYFEKPHVCLFLRVGGEEEEEEAMRHYSQKEIKEKKKKTVLVLDTLFFHHIKF